MCCAIGALLIAVLAGWRRWLAAAGLSRPLMRSGATVVAGAIVLAAGTALATQHFEHYAGRAKDSGRSLLEEILVQPLCSGAPVPRIERDAAAR